MAPRYCTVEDVQNALEERASAYDQAAILRAIDSATGDVDDAARLAPGAFRPVRAVRTFRIPPRRDGIPLRLYLEGRRLNALTSVTADGADVTGSVILQPAEYGPPYAWLDLDGEAFADPIVVTATWGHGDDHESAGTLAALAGAGDAMITVSDASLVGIGDQLRIDTERLEVTARAWTPVTGGALAGAGLSASVADRAMTVADGTKHRVGELLLVDSERVRVVDIAGNVVTVLRAQDGSVLAAHTAGTAVNAQRLLAVTRGAQGSTAAGHAANATVWRHVVPGPVRTLAIASAVSTLLAERRGYATQAGPNTESGPKMTPAGLGDLRDRVAALYGRPVRSRAV